VGAGGPLGESNAKYIIQKAKFNKQQQQNLLQYHNADVLTTRQKRVMKKFVLGGAVSDLLLRPPSLHLLLLGRACGKLEFGALPVLLNAHCAIISRPCQCHSFHGGNTPTMLMRILATNNAATIAHNKQLVFSGKRNCNAASFALLS
jgi:hypothetical protein